MVSIGKANFDLSQTIASGTRDFSITFGSRILLLALTIGTQSCLAWFLGVSGRGSYAVCFLFATLLGLLFGVGCDIASIYFVASGRFSLSEGITYAIIYCGIGSALAITAGLILMQSALPFFNKASPTSFYLALATIPTLLLSLAFLALLTSVQQFAWFAAISVLGGLVRLLLTVVFVWLLSWDVNGALLAVLIAGITTITATLLLFCRKNGIVLVRPSFRRLLDMFLYGIRYYLGDVSSQVNFRLGTIILAFFATKEEVGLFAVALQVLGGIMIVPGTLGTLLMPKVAGDQGGKKELVAQCARLTALTCGALLLALASFAKPIVMVLFSPAFLPIVPIIRILCAGVLVRCVGKVFAPYLLGMGYPEMVSISVAIGAAVNVGTLWLLLPVIGLAGAASALVISYFVSSTVLTFFFVRFSGLSLRQTFQYAGSDWALIGRTAAQVCRGCGISRMLRTR